MAVVQISKIQVRRGRKNSISGVPQLSAAEFAWTLDTQELFIGNGSVADGAPYVGNTKILTEHDNILELASSYRFSNEDPSISASVPRRLQNKLDEYVSVADFGAKGDGATDSVLAFETALNQLFRNANSKYKKVLIVPNGEYLFSSDFRIPSTAIIRGETQDGVILNIGSNNIRFVTSDGQEFVDFNSGNKPQKIHLQNLTISRTTGSLVLSGVSGSQVENVTFKGTYDLGDPYSSVPTIIIDSIVSNLCYTTSAHGLVVGDRFIPKISSNGLVAGLKYFVIEVPAPNQFYLSREVSGTREVLVNGGPLSAGPGDDPDLIDLLDIEGDVISDIITPLASENAAVFWNNILFGIRTTDVVFKNCTWQSVSLGVKCNQTVAFETNVKFQDCNFFENDTSIYIAGVQGQQNQWQILDCEFNEIANQVFRSTNGLGTLLQRCKFRNCGNGTGAVSSPEDYIVYFGEKNNNMLIDCTSDRQQAAGIVSSDTVVAIPEVYNGDKSIFLDRNYSPIYLSDNFRPLAVFSSLSNYILINYSLTLGAYSRVGRLTLSIGDSASEIAITDEFQYSSALTSLIGGTIMTNFEFAASLADNDSDSGIDTVVLSYKNPLPGATGNISFDVTYGV